MHETSGKYGITETQENVTNIAVKCAEDSLAARVLFH